MAKPVRVKQAGSAILMLFAAVVAIALVLLTQQAIAAQLGGFVAGLWVSTMGAVMSFIAAAVGG